jgi:hypothetical protein
MADLEALAIKFNEWRGNRRNCRYPKYFWEEIREISRHYPVSIIAKALNINVSYLKQRLYNGNQQLTFVPVGAASFPLQASIEFIDHKKCAMTVRFQADHGQLVKMILSLSGSAQ